MNAIRAFREEFVTSGQTGVSDSDFTSFDARKVRYAILWSFYENDVYRLVHDWATTYKTRYGLYKYTRSIYSPAYRLGEFYKSHIWGGSLDDEAMPKGALPIVTQNEVIRPAIAQLWTWSNWGINKDITTLKGAVLGDAIIRVIDDTAARKVYLEYVNPATVESLDVDVFGNIKGYTIIETRTNPVGGRDCEYKEIVTREGQQVVYRTYLNGSPYEWNGQAAEWAEDYGFVPMVHVEHNNVGSDWGWSEMHPARSKIHEVDDLASMLSDQMRKTINPVWLMAGMKKDENNKTIKPSDASGRQPEPGREQIPMLYASDPNAKPHPMVAEIDFAGVISHITEILKELERDYPELKFDALRAAGELSGTALRIARQPAETKVNQRRGNYDNGLVRAQQMALTIGGLRNYDGFPFNLDSYANGALNHSIGNRSVFSVDPIDKLAEDTAFWLAAKGAVEAGYPLELFLMDAGWEDKRVKRFVATRAELEGWVEQPVEIEQ